MKLYRLTVSGLRQLLSPGRLYARATGLVVVVLSLSTLLLAAAPMSSAPGGDTLAPIARQPLAVQTPQQSAPNATTTGAEGDFHPGALPVVSGTWTAEGPGPITSGQAVAAPNNSVVGAVKAIAAHPSDPNTIYVGAVNGGIWKSTNGGTTWTPQTDALNSLSIGAVKFDPTDGSHNTLIAGLGRFSSISSAGTLATAFGGPKSGVLLTTDGSNWAPPPGGGPGSVLDGANITGVAARGKILLAGSDRGMYRSTNTGNTFALISGAPGSGLPAGTILDIAEEPSANVIPHGVVMVSDGFGGVEEWGNNGQFIKTIFTSSSQDAGSTFDAAGNFYVTLFGGESVNAFDPTGKFHGFVGPASGYNLPESVEQDNFGNFFVGNAGFGYKDPTTGAVTDQCKQPPDNKDPANYPPCPLFEFDPTFSALLNTYYPDTEARGTDWGALVPVPSTNPPTRQCVMRYTSEGLLVKQFDICAGTQLSDFATLPGGNAYELQIAPNGDTFVADADEVVRLDASGNIIGTYLAGAGSASNPLFAVNFDPDGTSFWTGTVSSGDVYKVDIATGNVLVHFNTSTAIASGITIKSSPLYAAVVGAGANDGVYKSNDSGQSWKLISNAAINNLLIDGTTQNVKIAVGTAGNLFVGIENAGQPTGTDLVGLFGSPDGGLTWTAFTLPTTTEACPATFGINPGGQGELHFSIAADPNNPKVVYVAGDRQPAPNELPGGSCAGPGFPNAANSIGAKDYTGRLFRVSDTGVAPLTNSGTANNTGPHADSRAMVFDAAGNILEGDDGGIFRRTSPADATGDWSSIVGNLQISELHDLAYDSVSQILFGGDQDTGAPSQSATGALPWNELVLGDGANVGVDTSSSAPNSIRYMSAFNILNFQARTFDTSNTQQGATVFPALTPSAGSPAVVAQFYTPLRVNSINPQRLLFGFNNDVYESLTQGATVSAVDLSYPSGSGSYGQRRLRPFGVGLRRQESWGRQRGCHLRGVGQCRLPAHGGTRHCIDGDRRVTRRGQHQ